MSEVLDAIARDGLTADEVSRGKGQLTGGDGARTGGLRFANEPDR